MIRHEEYSLTIMLESCSRRQSGTDTQEGKNNKKQVKHIRVRTGNHQGTESEHRDETIKIKQETDQTQTLTLTAANDEGTVFSFHESPSFFVLYSSC